MLKWSDVDFDNGVIHLYRSKVSNEDSIPMTRRLRVTLESRRKAVGPEYSCSLRKIDMVKAVNGREFNNVAGFRCSYGTTVRRVTIQGLVRSPGMVVIQIRRHKSLQMPLVEHDDVVRASEKRRRTTSG